MGIYNYIDKKNDSNIHESNEEKIQKIYEEIYALKIKDEPNIIDELIIMVAMKNYSIIKILMSKIFLAIYCYIWKN